MINILIGIIGKLQRSVVSTLLDIYLGSFDIKHYSSIFSGHGFPPIIVNPISNYI